MQAIIQASVLSLSLSLDALAASFAYGCTGTRVPLKSVMVINIICTSFLGVALFAGAYASRFIPAQAGILICFAVLMIIGIIKLLQGLFSKSNNCINDRQAQVKVLKPIEAALIASALSLDGIAAGFAAALGGVNAAAMLVVSLAAHMAAVPLGAKLGRRLSQTTKLNVSWIGGAVIIILAVTKLF
jgi:putative Mn2+ efflux pump MntP